MFRRQSSRELYGWQRRVCVSITFRWVCSSMFVAEFREDIRITIPSIFNHLKYSSLGVCNSAIKLLSRLAMQGIFSITFWSVCLNMPVAELCKDIQVALPDIVEWMRNSNQETEVFHPGPEVFNPVLELLSELTACCRCHYCSLIDILQYILQLTSAMQCK